MQKFTARFSGSAQLREAPWNMRKIPPTVLSVAVAGLLMLPLSGVASAASTPGGQGGTVDSMGTHITKQRSATDCSIEVAPGVRATPYWGEPKK